jgi:hypothetical protein
LRAVFPVMWSCPVDELFRLINFLAFVTIVGAN